MFSDNNGKLVRGGMTWVGTTGKLSLSFLRLAKVWQCEWEWKIIWRKIWSVKLIALHITFFYGQLNLFSVWPYFQVYPNTIKRVKCFPKFFLSGNKHSLEIIRQTIDSSVELTILWFQKKKKSIFKSLKDIFEGKKKIKKQGTH